MKSPVEDNEGHDETGSDDSTNGDTGGVELIDPNSQPQSGP